VYCSGATRAHARSTNRGPGFSTDAHALNLSAQPPRDGNELFERSKGLRALRSAQRQELLAVLQAPLSADELDFARFLRH